jgi:alkylation response protein AidB-like acyl-CoA dehydrogenase
MTTSHWGAYITAELAGRAAEHDRDATFPFEGVELVHKHGLLTARHYAKLLAESHAGPALVNALAAATVLVRSLASEVDAGSAGAAERAGIGKLVGTRAAIRAVEEAVALIGNNALNRRNPLERHLRDVLCARIHTPQDDTILAAAGRAALSRYEPPAKEPRS